MEFDDLLAEVEGLLDSPVNAAVIEMGHLFARNIGVSAGLDVLPATHRTAFLLMLISLNKNAQEASRDSDRGRERSRPNSISRTLRCASGGAERGASTSSAGMKPAHRTAERRVPIDFEVCRKPLDTALSGLDGRGVTENVTGELTMLGDVAVEHRYIHIVNGIMIDGLKVRVRCFGRVRGHAEGSSVAAHAMMARGDLTLATRGCTRLRMEGTPPDDGGAVGSAVAALGGDSEPSTGPDFCRGAQPEEEE